MEKAWFEQWFDTNYYHILYSHRDEGEARAFIESLMQFLDIQKGSEVIDIGCGRGRHSKYMCELGYNVTGIDIACSNIDYARRWEEENLHFHCFDKRNVFSKGKFDLALNLFTSYGFLKSRTELEGALKSMGENLKKGGIFVLDYMNAEKIRNAHLTSDVIDTQGIRFEISKRISGHQIIKEIEVIDGSSRSHFAEEVHLITLPEFRELFQFASLEILHTFGDYRLHDYEEQFSDRLIIIARKR